MCVPRPHGAPRALPFDLASPCPQTGGRPVREALRWAAVALAPTSSTPRLDAEVLLAHVLSVSRAQLHLRWNHALGSARSQSYRQLVRQRAAHEPVAYLVGVQPFYDVDLRVDRRVLIPRPETEHLIEEALSWAQRRSQRPLRLVDVGTGCGALVIVLARHLPHAQAWAVDVSRQALEVAASNLDRHGLREQVKLVCGDLLSSLRGPFDLIVANLPYVASEGLPHLPPDITAFEPRLALDGGQDGLALVRRLLAQCPDRLAPGGLVLLEIGDGQGQAVCRVVREHLPLAQATVLRDYAGLERVVRFERPGVPGCERPPAEEKGEHAL